MTNGKMFVFVLDKEYRPYAKQIKALIGNNRISI